MDRACGSWRHAENADSCKHLWSHFYVIVRRKYEHSVVFRRIVMQKLSKLEHVHTLL